MRDNIKIVRSSNGEVVDIEYYLNGVRSNPEKRFTLTMGDRTIYYIYMQNAQGWQRIVTGNGSNNVRITTVPKVLMKDYLIAREITK